MTTSAVEAEEIGMVKKLAKASSISIVQASVREKPEARP
jgi:hypothetical protein